MRLIAWAAIISAVHDGWTFAALVILVAAQCLLDAQNRSKTRRKRMR
jgi:hypothetical protein